MKITIFKDQFCTMRTKLIAFVLLVPFIAFSQKEKKGLPLKAERFFELSTTSGTWMSVDVHPSGEKINATRNSFSDNQHGHWNFLGARNADSF